MIATIDLPSQGGALQGTRTEVEGEGNQSVELAFSERHGDQAQDGLLGGDASGELLPLMCDGLVALFFKDNVIFIVFDL